MLLDEILERNRSYVRAREPQPLPPVRTLNLLVVACYDPRLDAVLLPALGLAPGDVFLLRTAGALVQPRSSVLRSLGLAVYMFGVTEVLVVGHTSCRMATFDASEFIDAFRGRGVARESFGDGDLRSWAGAISSPAAGAQLSMANIREASFLPPDLSVSAVVLNDTTGQLEVVHPREAPLEAHAPSHVDPVDKTSHDLVQAFDTFVRSVPDQAHWRRELSQLREGIARAANPLDKLALIERFARRAGAESAEVLAAFDRLERETLARLRNP